MKKVYAVDVRSEAIRKANKEVLGAHFAMGSAIDLPFKNEIFDKVILFEVIEHIPIKGERTALSEANRILKPGGFLVISVPKTVF